MRSQPNALFVSWRGTTVFTCAYRDGLHKVKQPSQPASMQYSLLPDQRTCLGALNKSFWGMWSLLLPQFSEMCPAFSSLPDVVPDAQWGHRSCSGKAVTVAFMVACACTTPTLVCSRGSSLTQSFHVAKVVIGDTNHFYMWFHSFTL